MIKVKLLLHSKSSEYPYKEITTWELEYPRFFHAELMTHRAFSRNAASSRAIPIKKMQDQVRNNLAKPMYWGKNQSGMQAKEYFLDGGDINECDGLWGDAAESALEHSMLMDAKGIHKQSVNRVLEPFQHIKTVVTTTELDNFFWLRNDEAAQPEFELLAKTMQQMYEESTPYSLCPGDWHLPYYGVWFDGMANSHDLETAKKISASCCAQVSYRNLDDSLEKAESIYNRLLEGAKPHASPFEHQATPVSKGDQAKLVQGGWPLVLPKGATHVTKKGIIGSGNFLGWIQNRQLIPNTTYYKDEN